MLKLSCTTGIVSVEKLKGSLMKPIVSVLLTAVTIFGCGCMTHQKNYVVKQNNIRRMADGSVVDNSVYTDKSKGFALFGLGNDNRHYDSQVNVGTDGHSAPVQQIVAAPVGTPLPGAVYMDYGGAHYGYSGSYSAPLPGAVYQGYSRPPAQRAPSGPRPLPGAVNIYPGHHGGPGRGGHWR